MKIMWIFLLLVVAALPVIYASLPAMAGSLDEKLYAGWDSALRKYVNNEGQVNYRSWKADRASLDSFLNVAAKLSARDCAQMSRDEKIALWINIYNAFTVKLVLDHYPLQRSGLNFFPGNSIRQINGVWDKYLVACCGQSVTLSQIENNILRGEFKEPRIHFAINCASASCPKLMNRAYRGATLQKDLDAAARRFINDPTRNKIDGQNHRLRLSKIFDWFGNDFNGHYGPVKDRSARESAVINFLQAYVQEPGRELISSNKFSLEYLPYDWSLNEQGGTK